MASSLLERLRAALGPEYEVERELGAGGMGIVFLGRDVTLEKHVAIKILRPELATATAAERFLREARILASLSHPNVVPVHIAREKDGIFYYVMDHIEGESAEQRLARGPMPAAEVVKLGADVLTALQAVHEQHVVHRDVKPGNIFIVEDRALLADFGVAKPTGEDSPLTQEGHRVGTPAYMAPEQVGGEATRKSDLYALGMVLYEALTGRGWTTAARPDKADWSGVPARLIPVLRRALAVSPDDRWKDAAAFRQALVQAAARGPGASLVKYARVAAPLAIIAAIVAYVLTRPSAPEPPVWDLAILPVEVYGWDAPIDGAQLASMVTSEIRGTPGVSVVSWPRPSDWWESAAVADSGPRETRAAAALGARKAALAKLYGDGDSVQVELEFYDDAGDALPRPAAITVAPARPQDVSNAIAMALVRLELDTVMHEGQRWTRDAGALREYLLGEDNFERGRGELARDHYRASVARDSTFMLAWWRLANAWRWLGEEGPYPKDYQALFDSYAADVGVLDSMLMVAQLTPAGPERLRRYQSTHESFPLEYFAAFLHGEELFNRGPLWGEPLERAVEELQEAVRLNPLWALAYMHLIWANIRLGHEEEARRYSEQLVEHAPDPDQSWTYPPELFQQAIRERFASLEEAEDARGMLLQTEWGQKEWVMRLARLAGAFDVPRAQVELGLGLLARGEAVPRPYQAAAHVAAGLGSVGLGRIDEALDHFDAAAEIHDTPEGRLHAAEWRVLPRIVGLDVVDSAEVERGRETLRSLTGQDSVGVRAYWALALDAYAQGDTISAGRLSSRVRSAPTERGAGPLGDFLLAVQEAAAGRYEYALDRSGSLLAVQTPTVLLYGSRSPGETLSDPFARSLLHLKRGQWYEEVGNQEAAEREYLWYEAVDVLGLPELGLPQAGEIDWALGNYGRLRRSMVTGDRDRACDLLRHVVDAWQEADHGFGMARLEFDQNCR